MQKVHWAGQPRERVERDERIEQERHVVAFDLKIALVDLRSKGQSIQFFSVQLAARGVVHDLAVFAIAGSENLIEGLAVCIFGDGVVEFAADDEIDVQTAVQCLFGLDVPVRTNKCHSQRWVGFLDFAEQLDITVKTDGRSEEDQELVVFANLNGLVPVNFMRRGIEQAAAGDHSSRIAEPDGIPVRFNLARRGPPRTGPTVEILEARGIQEQRLHSIWHYSPSA